LLGLKRQFIEQMSQLRAKHPHLKHYQAQQQEDEKVEEISYFAYEEIKQPVSGPYRLRFDANRMRKNNDVGYKPLS
jgi:hypothetical protein